MTVFLCLGATIIKLHNSWRMRLFVYFCNNEKFAPYLPATANEMRSKASGLLRFIKHKPNPFKLVKMRGWSGGKTFCRVFRAALQKRNWTAGIGQELDSADLHNYLCNNRAKTTHSFKHCASAGTHMHAASLPEQWLCICILVLPVHAECQVVQGKEGTWVIWTKQRRRWPFRDFWYSGSASCA